MAIQIKRIYDTAAAGDGYRVLVDRLWPRGVSKAQAHVDLWLKDIAPSAELRQWFGHDPAKWDEFRKRYLQELRTRTDPRWEELCRRARRQTVTLLYGPKEERFNNAVVLREFAARARRAA